ncbi:MAG: hypothetical protein OEZ68_15510 [Gammaproteobacteria bacterium]|nr:hypothetical protein [Gammaproteobacteria bacterium]MDH5802209.1 hypothetical protein [Gammaproteobacteria bacterium]
MKIFLIILSVILVCGVFTYTLFNRDSDRVVLTFATAMLIGTLGFITKESISNKQESWSKSIPVAVFYGLPSYRPLNLRLPYSFDLNVCTQNIDPNDLPKKSKEIIDINFGSNKYFDAIQYIVIKSIFERFHKSWNVIAKKTRAPNGVTLRWQRIEEKKGKVIKIKEIYDSIPDNYFVKKGLYEDIPKPFGGEATFPPDVAISVESEEGSNTLSILFDTNYVTLHIRVSESQSSIGIGEYSKLFGITPATDRTNKSEGDKFGNSLFYIDAEYKQNLWLNGHPEMAKHRNWANAIVELLDDKFNYESIREEHLRQFQLFGADAIREL